MLEQKYKHMALMCQKNIVPTDKTLRSCVRLTFALFALYSINDVPVFCENCPNDICKRRWRGKRAELKNE